MTAGGDLELDARRASWLLPAAAEVRSARGVPAGAQVVGIDSGTVMLRLQVRPPAAVVHLCSEASLPGRAWFLRVCVAHSTSVVPM